MKIRRYTENLSFEDLKEIISNFQEFEKNLVIGDCLLRSLTEKIVNDNGISDQTLILWMEILTHDCYRIIAEKAMEQGFKF